jgi:putative PLP-dependent aminotransferase (TIGR04422 family)
MIDNQWPYPKINSTDIFNTNIDSSDCVKLTSEIENYFKKIFDTEVILVPSGRAAISILLTYFNINRSHTVFAPKWTSHCVWDIVTRLANPITEFKADCDLAIAVHKWGKIEKFSNTVTSKIIEDSVDSIISSPKTLFPNNGDVEIFSLPKIIGSYTGGLIVVKVKKIADAIRESIKYNYELGSYQSKLRFDYCQDKNNGFEAWEHCEHRNTTVDYNGLISIKNKLPNFEINNNRLPPLITLETKKYKETKNANLMTRFFNVNCYLDKPDYRKGYLLPLHFNITDEAFNYMLNSIERSC